MLKRILPAFIILSAAIFLFACDEANTASQQPSQQSLKIGVADVARLMRESVPGKEGIKYLETQQLAFQKELDAIQDRLEKNPSDEEAMKELQKVYAVSQQRIQAEGQNVASLIFDTVQKVLDSYREEKGLEVILSQDTIASFDRKLDLTTEIMAILDKQKIDFKPLPEPASVPQASEQSAPADNKEQPRPDTAAPKQ